MQSLLLAHVREIACMRELSNGLPISPNDAELRLIFFELFRVYDYFPTVRDLLINERDGIMYKANSRNSPARVAKLPD